MASRGTINLYRLVTFGGFSFLMGLAAVPFVDRERDQFPALLEAKITSVAAARPCQLAEVFVKSGQAVTPGTPLLRFMDERLEGQLVSKRRELAESEVKLRQSEAAADVETAWRRRELQGEIYATQLQVTRLQQERLSRQVEQVAWKEHLENLEQWTGLSESDHRVQPISLTQPLPNPVRLMALLKEDAAACAAEAIQAQLELSERRLQELTKLTEELDQKIRISVGVDVVRANHESLEQQIAALETRQRDLTITSPTHATVGLWMRQPGDTLAAGEVVVELLDNAQLCVRAFLPSEKGAQLEPGQKLSIVFPGEVQREGRVDQRAPQTSLRLNQTDEATLPVTIAPQGKLWPRLPSGTRVQVCLPRT